MKRKNCWWLGLVVLVWFAASLQSGQAGRVLNDALVTRPFRHHIWQEVLTQNINAQGEVDWARLRANPGRLNQYLEQLEAVSPDTAPELFPTWEEQAAYWVNAHNAVALRLILDAYPVSSLGEVPAFASNHRYKLGGKPYGVAEILPNALAFHRLPWLVFTLTDYSWGTPRVLPMAYEGETLKAQVERAAQSTLKDTQLVQFSRNRGLADCGRLQLSGSFRTYETVLFAEPAGLAEDRDLMTATSNPEGSIPTEVRTWLGILRPLANPRLYRTLGQACSSVSFTSPDLTLRQVNLL